MMRLSRATSLRIIADQPLCWSAIIFLFYIYICSSWWCIYPWSFLWCILCLYWSCLIYYDLALWRCLRLHMLFVVVTLTLGLIVVHSMLVSTLPRLLRIGSLALLETTYAIRGGHSSLGANCGAFFVLVVYVSSSADWNRGAAWNYICCSWWLLDHWS